jgi:hypothetical protein
MSSVGSTRPLTWEGLVGSLEPFLNLPDIVGLEVGGTLITRMRRNPPGHYRKGLSDIEFGICRLGVTLVYPSNLELERLTATFQATVNPAARQLMSSRRGLQMGTEERWAEAATWSLSAVQQHYRLPDAALVYARLHVVDGAAATTAASLTMGHVGTEIAQIGRVLDADYSLGATTTGPVYGPCLYITPEQCTIINGRRRVTPQTLAQLIERMSSGR